MLKALELYGFKSFADKTRFDFPDGITVVVGPNGSGKSNIVDAIKWVLGEQSAKGLRGKDMADVIFKGSGTSGGAGRKPLNSAEASLVLENTDRRFDFDADEILVTRRVYRSGEGEYLINGEPCRLKDIRQLFRGTGAGTDAYSLIEQGKVDRLLQASPKDRRAIFEEAAGISRFKAKKVETQRRLARVEQNLIRLSDIVEEVENRLRTVKAQATKAVRYKEFTERLQELRTFVGMTDYRRITERLDVLETEQREFQQTLVACGEQVAGAERTLAEADEWLSDVVASAAEDDGALAKSRQLIAEQESQRQLYRSRGAEAEAQMESTRRQLSQQNSRMAELEKLVAEQSQRLEDAQVAYHDAQATVQRAQAELDRIASQSRTLRGDLDAAQAERATAASERLSLSGRIEVHEKQLAQTRQNREQLQERVERWGLQESQLRGEQSELEQRQAELQSEMERRSSELSQARSELKKATARQASLSDKSSSLRTEYNGVCQRAAVIEELEEKLEGLNSGVKQLLRESQQHREGPYRSVVGLVADLIQVNVQQANLVDAALGEMAQHLVVEDDQLVDMLAAGRLNLEGRVGLIRLGKFQGHGTLREDLTHAQGVIGRADQMVQTAPGFTQLAQQLLGGTWIVKTMADALRLRDQWARDVRYITLDGQIAELDGTLLVGPKSRGLGIVSRRSELRALKRDMQRLEEEQELVQEHLIDVRERVESQTEAVDRFSSQQEELAKQLADQQLMVQSVQQKLDRVQQDLVEGREELGSLELAQEQLDEELASDTEGLAEAEERLSELEEQIESLQRNAERLEEESAHWNQAVTQGKVALATCEQKLANEEARSADQHRDVQERQEAVDDLAAQLQRLEDAFESAQLEQLLCTSRLADGYVEKERLQAKIRQRESVRRERQAERQSASRELETIRVKQRQLETELHQVELELGQLSLERSQLSERLRDDYGIEISQIEVELSEDEQRERDEIDQEIETLRRKINSIGAVNLDALAELEELDGRFQNLEAQYQDLDTSKKMLEKIIDKINHDSRRLFAETLEAIRSNFQSLYRRSFGGGKADLVIEEGVDILEAGIDIVATPPGKPEFNNSLLSGGERALTAVSLLMGIFQHRPSPFCVLDEVDAPFDEANIGRFIDVLKGFLGSTKFIIVTHSKKTMTAADTLYGVTMQESGVSKQVSVRFEDVSDDGEISDDAVNRQQQEDVA